MNRERYVVHCCAHLNREGRLADQVRGFRTHNLDAEDEAIFLVRNYFHESLRLTRREGPPQGRELEPAPFDLEACLGGLGLCKTCAGHLRVAEDCVWDHLPVCGRWHTCYALGGYDGFLGGLVREERWSSNVAYRVDAWNVRLHLVIGRDVSSGVGADTDFLEVHPLGSWFAANADEDPVDLDGQVPLWRFDFHFRLRSSLRYLQDLGFQVDLRPPALKLPVDHADDVGVAPWQQLVHDFHHDDIASQLLVHRREFESNGPSSDNEHPSRDDFELETFLGTNYEVTVKLQTWETRSSRPSGYDEVLAGYFLPPVGGGDYDSVLGDDLCLTHDDVRMVALEE